MAFSEFPTVAHQLYQLAGGERTALELTRRSLAAIEASQPTLNAFRVVLAERALAATAGSKSTSTTIRCAINSADRWSACPMAPSP